VVLFRKHRLLSETHVIRVITFTYGEIKSLTIGDVWKTVMDAVIENERKKLIAGKEREREVVKNY
jgi:hypothetical protein